MGFKSCDDNYMYRTEVDQRFIYHNILFITVEIVNISII
jgi:hypothetical protein